MRKFVLLCLVLIIAGCGGRREASGGEGESVDGFLQRIFARDRADAQAQEGGGLCGNPMLVGSVEGRVPGAIAGCGIDSAVRLQAVGDITLSQGALMTCGTANALEAWVNGAVRPAFADQGGGLRELKVAAHYVCRTRNHQPGAKISEHGKGRAIDISAFRLQDGSEVTVQEGWRSKAHSVRLRALHRAACGPFGTVLGPESDRFHQNHFHMDTAQYRSGPFCR